MKVRAIRELPFVKIGEEFESVDNIGMFYVNGMNLLYIDMLKWVEKGWFEEVKKEIKLEDKFTKFYNDSLKTMGIHWAEDLSRIAKEHYSKIVKDCTDDFIASASFISFDLSAKLVTNILEAIEEEK